MQTQNKRLIQRKALRADLVAACFLLPFTVIYSVFTIYPVFQGAYMSFYKWNLMGKQGFLGWENYSKMFSYRRDAARAS